MRDRWPIVSLYVMVDDITLEAIGSARFVLQIPSCRGPRLVQAVAASGAIDFTQEMPGAGFYQGVSGATWQISACLLLQ
eukprot:6743081-Pyramimonas_sp.AAC.1